MVRVNGFLSGEVEEVEEEREAWMECGRRMIRWSREGGDGGVDGVIAAFEG